MNIPRVLVCGGRDFDDFFLMDDVLSDILHSKYKMKDLIIIEGGAIGADFLARVWARYCGFEYLEFLADWKTHGKAAGPIRNKQMLEEGKPDLVVAFPGGVGTANMIKLAREANIEVREI